MTGRVRLFIVFVASCALCAATAGTEIRVLVRDQYGAQNPEQIKTLNKTCPEITITSDPQARDYMVEWETKTWKDTSWSGHQNEFNIYNRAGDLVGSGSAHKISNAAKDICTAIRKAAKPKEK